MTLQIGAYQVEGARAQASADRVAAQGAQITHIKGQFLLQLSGEGLAEIPFPVKFAEKPGFSFGAELDDNQSLSAGAFPTYSVTVARWIKEELLPGIFLYTGATLAVVVDDNPGWLWIHWHMEGMAFRNPLKNVATPDEVI